MPNLLQPSSLVSELKGKNPPPQREKRDVFFAPPNSQHNMAARRDYIFFFSRIVPAQENKFDGANHKSILYLPLYAWMARFSNHHCVRWHRFFCCESSGKISSPLAAVYTGCCGLITMDEN
jgi:hypothetical protein